MKAMSDAPPKLAEKEPVVGLKPPQFRLRTMLLAVTFLAILLAVAKFWSAAAVVFFAFFLVAIVLHVAGNVLGTQLRQNRGGGKIPGRESRTQAVVPTDVPPATRLGDKSALGQPIRILTIVLSILSAGGGCIWTWYQYGRNAGWENYLVAVVAFGLLGAIWSFLVIGFMQVRGGAFLQATRGHSREEQAVRERDQHH